MSVGPIEVFVIIAVAVMLFSGTALAFVMAITSRRGPERGHERNPIWPLALATIGLLVMVIALGFVAKLLLLR